MLIFIHRSISLSKQPSSPASLSDPHLEEPSIKAELGNTELIIYNVYIPPASSCSNGYQSSIEHLLTTPDTRILENFNAHHPSWYSRSTDTRGRKMADSINGSDYGILNWDSPRRVSPNAEPSSPNAEPSSPDVSLASASLMLLADTVKDLMRSKNTSRYFSFYVDNISIKHIPLGIFQKYPLNPN